MGVHHVESADEFKDIISKNKFVIADFYADWCGPCKAIAPLYEKLATENGVDSQLAFVKVNVDNVPAVAQEYNVTAMPTFLFFDDGKTAPVEVTVPKGGAVIGPKGVEYIRGADPRALTAVAVKLGQDAKTNAA